MSKKFIPNGDTDFATMAEAFARSIARDPARFAVSEDESAALSMAVAQFRKTLNAVRFGSRSQIATAEKEAARLDAEKRIRRIAHLVRANDSIDALARMELGFRERKSKPKVLTVPNESPRLKFVRAIHDAGRISEHELSFMSRDLKARPEGAVRLELFVDLIAPDAPIPTQPGMSRGGSTPIYLRSYTRSPIRLMPPTANVPMRVVYWGRWADSTGNVDPFSETAVGWIEGGSQHLMAPALGNAPRPMRAEIIPRAELPEPETTVVIALLEAQRSHVGTNHRVQALLEPVKRDLRQLEGPDAEAA